MISQCAASDISTTEKWLHIVAGGFPCNFSRWVVEQGIKEWGQAALLLLWLKLISDLPISNLNLISILVVWYICNLIMYWLLKKFQPQVNLKMCTGSKFSRFSFATRVSRWNCILNNLIIHLYLLVSWFYSIWPHSGSMIAGTTTENASNAKHEMNLLKSHLAYVYHNWITNGLSEKRKFVMNVMNQVTWYQSVLICLNWW